MNLERLTLWPAGFLASLSVCQGSDAARRTTATSGRKLFALCDAASPIGCLSRMLLASSVWRSTWCMLTWKAQATPAGQLYFRLVPSARRISESACSSWRTPQAQDAKSGRMQQGVQYNLTHQVLWPTPLSSDSEHGGPNSKDRRGRYHLTGLVHQETWPTPTAIDAGSGRVNRSASPGARERPTLALLTRKSWPTPIAGDYRNGKHSEQTWKRNARPLNETVTAYSPSASGRLNPDWVEALMGLPIGWTVRAGPPLLESHSTGGNPHAQLSGEIGIARNGLRH